MAEKMMKVLVGMTQDAFNEWSYLEDQTAIYDFNWVDAMEILTLPTIVCEGLAEYRVRCGCGRAFGGLTTCKTTTLGLVTYAQRDAVYEHLLQSKQVESWGEDLSDAFWNDLQCIEGALLALTEGRVMRIQSTPGHFAIYPADKGPQDVLGDLTLAQANIMT